MNPLSERQIIQNKPQKQPAHHWSKNVMWFTHGSQCFGIVRVDDRFDGTKYYIGVGNGYGEKSDFDRIMAWGAKFPREAGDVLFKEG